MYLPLAYYCRHTKKLLLPLKANIFMDFSTVNDNNSSDLDYCLWVKSSFFLILYHLINNDNCLYPDESGPVLVDECVAVAGASLGRGC